MCYKNNECKDREPGMRSFTHPTYSPDLAPSDYHFFRSMHHFVQEINYTPSKIFTYWNLKRDPMKERKCVKKRKNQLFSQGMHIFQNFFFLKYFLVDKLTIFYRKKGRKMTLTLKVPGTR